MILPFYPRSFNVNFKIPDGIGWQGLEEELIENVWTKMVKTGPMGTKIDNMVNHRD